MKSVKGISTTIVVLVTLTLSFVPDETVSNEEVKLWKPKDLGVEVLLNDPDLEFDMSVLDDLMEKGSVTIPGQPDDISQDDIYHSGDLPRIYLMRSAGDPKLGVVIAEEDFTDFLFSQGVDNPMKGISVSIMVPGTKILVNQSMAIYSIHEDNAEPINESVEDDISDLGFSNIDFQITPDFREVRCFLENIRITLYQYKIEFENVSSWDLNIEVEVLDRAPEEEVKEQILFLLELFEGPSSFWEESSSFNFTTKKEMVYTYGDLDPEKIDWDRIMREELKRLMDIGLIRGLDEEDISSISQQCQSGLLGFRNRIFYDFDSQSWTYYNSTGYPLPIFGYDGGITIYNGDEFPDTDGFHGDDSKVKWIVAGIIIVLVSTLIGAFLFHRMNTMVKISNERRRMIYETIRLEPGIHFSAIMKKLSLKPGVASYHINKLEKSELIKSNQDGMYRRFYLYDEKVELKLRLSDLQKMIVDVIMEEPGISQIQISQIIGKSKVVINYHVRFLRDLGVLIMEKDGRETHCFLTPQGINLLGD